MGWWDLAVTATLTALMVAAATMLGAIGTLLVSRVTARAARVKLIQEIDDRRRADRVAETAAHTTAQAALAAVSEQLALSSYQYADRLRLELDRLEQRHADEMLRHADEMSRASQKIESLQVRVAEMQREIEVLQGQVHPQRGVPSPMWGRPNEGTGS